MILAVAGGFVWEFAIKRPQAERRVWQGTIVEKYKKRDWLKGLRRPEHDAQYYYSFYWRVRCEDDRTIAAEVPWLAWKNSEVGDPARKARGERWPRLAEPEAHVSRL